MPGTPAIDVLIVSFNTKEALRDTLASLLAHAPPPQAVTLGVHVLDNASTDGSPEMIVDEFPSVVLTRSGANLGFGRANNLLASASTADYVLLLNSDVIITQDVVQPLLSTLEEDSRTIAAGPRMVFPDGTVQYSAHRFPDLVYELAQRLRGQRLGRLLSPIFDTEAKVRAVHEIESTDHRTTARRPEYLWATCWLLRRSDVVETGLFDDTFPMYDEDLDFCQRASARGRTLRYVPEVELVHLGGASTANSRAKVRLMRRARRRYYRRHHGAFCAAFYAWGLPAVDRLVWLVERVPRPPWRRSSNT